MSDQATMNVRIRTPIVPDRLAVNVPGATRAVTVSLADLSEADIERVGAAYTAKLKERRAELVDEQDAKANA